jgi:hypothetical protein
MWRELAQGANRRENSPAAGRPAPAAPSTSHRQRPATLAGPERRARE